MNPLRVFVSNSRFCVIVRLGLLCFFFDLAKFRVTATQRQHNLLSTNHCPFSLLLVNEQICHYTANAIILKYILDYYCY